MYYTRVIDAILNEFYKYIIIIFRLSAGAPSSKIIVGIAAYARTWKMDSESEISGVPPLHVDGPGEAGTLQIITA